MASGDRELTHNEIWDDSALIDSWDQALEEYKKYHSLHKNGGNVKDLLKTKNEDGTSDAKQNLHEIDESSNHGRLETASEIGEDNPNDGQETENVTSQHDRPRVVGAPPAPAGLLGSIRDEGLKKLLMSWYYAGYYTGYYEGQRDSPQN
ncbi:putative SMN family protein Smn1 [Rosellinia necatrix]|uniref:Putative SMN family protein Smn1 n=1 Tax=Rosellinia necatrix TaxID=77044 RepID=A0A1S8A6P5_ROSNE|nr:putative SMN family protein Smn1 [Rosellinia necatrix]